MIFGELSSTNNVLPHERPAMVGMSSVTDFSYSPSAEEKSRNAAQIAATGRRNWKTLRGKGEAVWPPHLEAALLEGLEKYDPEECRPSRSARFPRRNKFISDYILQATGKKRTAKQVGSRLQQMRDTCKGPEIVRLLFRRTKDDREYDDNRADASPMSNDEFSDNGIKEESPPLNDETVSNDGRSRCRRSSITDTLVIFVPTSEVWQPQDPVIPISRTDRSSLFCCLPPLLSEYPPGIWNSKPEVTLVSPFPLSSKSSFSVYVDGTDAPVHTEDVMLDPCVLLSANGWPYMTRLIPTFWNTFTVVNDPRRYKIIQQVEPVSDSLECGLSGSFATITYKFNFLDLEAGGALHNLVLNNSPFSPPRLVGPKFSATEDMPLPVSAIDGDGVSALLPASWWNTASSAQGNPMTAECSTPFLRGRETPSYSRNGTWESYAESSSIHEGGYQYSY